MVRERHPSIVVQTLLSTTQSPWLDRWFDAVVSALKSAARVNAIERWCIVAGGIAEDGPLDAVGLARLHRWAQDAGGDFAHVFLGADFDPAEAHGHLLPPTDGDLVLIVDSNSIILSSTIARMVESLGSGVGAVDARELPVDDGGTRGLDAIGTARACLLFSRRLLYETTGLAPNSVSGGAFKRTRSSPHVSVPCPEAVVFCDRRLTTSPAGSVETEAGGEVTRGSVLEEVISSRQLSRAREVVADALTEPGEVLLSVVMRTQVLRPEALRDALLCLAGQSDGRFELLLVVHDGDSEEARRILDDQPEWLKSRARVLTASGGTRSRPLNVGISAASGSLIAFLDDDDLVFAHWVESFLDAAVRYPRRLLRASAGVQHVTATMWAGGVEGHSNESRLSTPYPEMFDMADHLRVNMTPFMAFAFPHRFFTVFGGADESLEVCEDWDLVLRAARVLGVGDVPALTAIYRRWTSGRDSYSAHDQTVWDRDMARVRDKLDALPLILPPGAASDLAGFSALRGVEAELAAVYDSGSWRVTAPLRLGKRLVGEFSHWIGKRSRDSGN